MAYLHLSPDIAFPQYEKLRNDPLRVRTLRRVDEILDALEDNPSQRSLRTVRFQEPPLWCVSFDANGEPWAILWSLDEDDTNIVLVDYIGPADFS